MKAFSVPFILPCTFSLTAWIYDHFISSSPSHFFGPRHLLLLQSLLCISSCHICANPKMILSRKFRSAISLCSGHSKQQHTHTTTMARATAAIWSRTLGQESCFSHFGQERSVRPKPIAPTAMAVVAVVPAAKMPRVGVS